MINKVSISGGVSAAVSALFSVSGPEQVETLENWKVNHYLIVLEKLIYFQKTLRTFQKFGNFQAFPAYLAVSELSGMLRNLGAPTRWGAGMCNVVFSGKGLYLEYRSLISRSDIKGLYLVSGLPRRYTGHLSKVKAVAAPVSPAVFLCLFIRAHSAYMAGCGAVNKALPNSCPGYFYAVRESRHPKGFGANSKVKGGHTMPDKRKVLSSPPRFTSLICSVMALVTAALFALPGCGLLPLGVSYV